jgi:Uma2 family endonuclease
VSVWVVDPGTLTVDVYRQRGQVIRYRDGDMIREEPTLPGFELTVRDAFEGD